jgi:putative transport protein
MAEEVQKMQLSAGIGEKKLTETTAVAAENMLQAPPKRIVLDDLGVGVFIIAAALGLIIGALTIPFSSTIKFSLGATGGALMMGLFFGHFGHIGKISLAVPKATLKAFRELGLVLFLAGSGIEGGLKLIEVFQWIHLVYGVILTLVPMIAGFLIARFVFKLDLLNNLGSICGGMTSTPALGSLISVSGTDDVAQSYAATYPIALMMLVFVPQIINLIFPIVI